MQLRTIAFSLAAALVAGLPSPKESRPDSILLHSRPIDNGTVEYWGVPGPESADWDWESARDDSATFNPPAPALQRRCGGNTVQCATSNLADGATCQQLIDYLSGDPAVAIDPNVEAVYVTSEDPNHYICAVTWSAHVPNLFNGYLVPAAVKVQQGCSSNGGLSGYATDVNLSGVCTVQCLSSAKACFA